MQTAAATSRGSDAGGFGEGVGSDIALTPYIPVTRQ